VTLIDVEAISGFIPPTMIPPSVVPAVDEPAPAEKLAVDAVQPAVR
jgi:hypothetical protein